MGKSKKVQRRDFFRQRVVNLTAQAEKALPSTFQEELKVVSKAMDLWQPTQEMASWYSGKKPVVVGVFTRTARDSRYLPTGEEIRYQGVSEDILEAAAQAGAMVQPILVTSPLAHILWQVSQCDVIIAPGTQESDIDPVFYGQTNTGLSGNTNAERDFREMIAQLYAILILGLPTLTICVGYQALVVAMGGWLYQDLNELMPGSMNHSCWGLGLATPAHSIRIAPESWLAQHVGSLKVPMNSLHHQGADEGGIPQDVLRVVALADDGVVEAVELQPSFREKMGLPDDMVVAGIQGHPEVKSGKVLFLVLLDVIRSAAGE